MATTDKGQQIMLGLLLSQYQESVKLQEYFMAFIGEMDYLFETIEDVYLGRLIEDAIGAQLDIIGEILQQSRNVDLGTIYFGFQGATAADGFGDINDPTVGGIFKDLYQTGATITPLDDATYKRVLLCKANLLNRETSSIEDIYEAVYILLDRVPKGIVLTSPANLQVQLGLSNLEIRPEEELLLLYMARYFIPSGITFTIILT